MSDQETAEVNKDVNPEELPVGEQAARYLKDALFGNPDVVPDGRDVAMGELFLAFLGSFDREEHDISALTEGANNAYQNWYNQADRLLRRDGAEPTEQQVQQFMAERLQAQLENLNGGYSLSEDANKKIKELMTGGQDAFVAAIENNEEMNAAASAAYQEKLKAYEQAKQGNPDAQKPEFSVVGILATIIEPNSDDRPTSFDLEAISRIDVTPEGQVEASLTAAFDGMHDFVKGGGGAERHLARIAGETWGPNAGETRGADHLKYEGINKIPGFGGVYNNDEALAAKIDEFASRSGLLEHEDYALTDTSSPGAANMDNLFIKPMEERGQISFGKEGATSTEIEAARAAWKAELVDALKDKLPKDEFRERMEKFAAARSDITLENESNPEAGKTDAEWEADVEALVEYDADQEELKASLEVGAAYPIAGHVVNFDAVRADGDMSMGTVPVVMAGLNATQTPMPEMGYGMQADGLAVNSPNDPRLGMNLGMA